MIAPIPSLPKLSVPTTVLAAKSDKAVSVEVMQGMASLIPGAEFVVIDGPHIVPLENPDGFTAAIEHHLSQFGS